MNLIDKIKALIADPSTKDHMAIFADWCEEHGLDVVSKLLRGETVFMAVYGDGYRSYRSTMNPSSLYAAAFPVNAIWRYVMWPYPQDKHVPRPHFVVQCECGQLPLAYIHQDDTPPISQKHFMVSITLTRYCNKKEFIIGAGRCINCGRVHWTTDNMDALIEAAESMDDKAPTL